MSASRSSRCCFLCDARILRTMKVARKTGTTKHAPTKSSLLPSAAVLPASLPCAVGTSRVMRNRMVAQVRKLSPRPMVSFSVSWHCSTHASSAYSSRESAIATLRRANCETAASTKDATMKIGITVADSSQQLLKGDPAWTSAKAWMAAKPETWAPTVPKAFRGTLRCLKRCRKPCVSTHIARKRKKLSGRSGMPNLCDTKWAAPAAAW
mmetsp:Transcript_66259/g.149592  ORF Transcript_66259/g.149592 Transcript_66259/m.149592 type:complete len:209 (+) Transcript_66259:609-1235(+)